jgi:hypothetical protein
VEDPKVEDEHPTSWACRRDHLRARNLVRLQIAISTLDGSIVRWGARAGEVAAWPKLCAVRVRSYVDQRYEDVEQTMTW